MSRVCDNDGCRARATSECAACGCLCQPCSTFMHRAPKTRGHVRTAIFLACDNDGCTSSAVLDCSSCGLLCQSCADASHRNAKTRAHVRTSLLDVHGTLVSTDVTTLQPMRVTPAAAPSSSYYNAPAPLPECGAAVALSATPHHITPATALEYTLPPTTATLTTPLPPSTDPMTAVSALPSHPGGKPRLVNTKEVTDYHRISSGHFGEVHSAVFENCRVVVKIPLHADLEGQMEEFNTLLAMTPHPNLLPLVAGVIDYSKQQVWLVFPFMTGVC
jgi:hypothetical protein